MADWKKLFDDAVGQIGEAASVAGQGLRQAAGEAGKVVGIGVGSLELRAARTTYWLGQTIRGTVALRLEQPLAARRLVVTLRATRTRSVRRDGHGPSTETEVVHELSIELDGDRTYASEEHDFELPLPPELEAQPEVGGLLGDAFKVARAFKSMAEGRLRWRLVATLEIPWKRNLSKAIDLDVREELREDEEEPPQRPKAGPRAPKAKAAPPPPKAEAAPPPPKAEAASPPPPRAEAAPPPPKAEAAPSPVPEPISLPGGWAQALSRTMCTLQGQGWVVIHYWAGAPVRPEVVRDALTCHPDLDPEILMLHGLMDGFELVVGKPLASRSEYASVQRAREIAAKHGGPLGALGELYGSGGLGERLEAELVSQGPEAVRVLELPTLERLLDDSEDFGHRDHRNVIFGSVVRGYGDYFGLTRADEIRRWREPPPGMPGRAGYFDHCARSYQARLREREREHPSQIWWVVRGEDHGATLREPAVLLRWSEMLALCLLELEHGTGG